MSYKKHKPTKSEQFAFITDVVFAASYQNVFLSIECDLLDAATIQDMKLNAQAAAQILINYLDE